MTNNKRGYQPTKPNQKGGYQPTKSNSGTPPKKP